MLYEKFANPCLPFRNRMMFQHVKEKNIENIEECVKDVQYWLAITAFRLFNLMFLISSAIFFIIS